ncbi:MAG: gliding motility-associated C-terminal domain-containing protein, partial [Cyanothece sp. SIO1E1]|nr:gliding motility-associated C-terminal domain-containing protein [Cyanothece sp. SIO1E1]
LVIKISDEKEVINVDLCDNEPLKLEAPVPAVWQNGVTSRTFQVSRPGVYTAQLLSDCGEGIREYIVEERDCNIQYFAPNAFSPNGDGINDRLEFFFKSDYEYTGELNIFDRWGNLVYTAQNVNFNNPIDWDGTYRGKALNSGVLVWVFRYISAKDNKTRMLSGDITLIR